ncbi:hypothetical protein KFL_004360080 [Klebsormidium nitens]|uniref:Uncharacterized protein n=1 Tax=Klebsormidium nitens TaxID=105231 RepID=A0A1Y1IIH6_KLENI|nr:hypothetical protein KFL_004360080 [Klebsormidium nitens]|eukprot:GAQ88526.1 hypothetical protein KFL_004360080 [Klebsormidium nitens]
MNTHTGRSLNNARLHWCASHSPDLELHNPGIPGLGQRRAQESSHLGPEEQSGAGGRNGPDAERDGCGEARDKASEIGVAAMN